MSSDDMDRLGHLRIMSESALMSEQRVATLLWAIAEIERLRAKLAGAESEVSRLHRELWRPDTPGEHQ